MSERYVDVTVSFSVDPQEVVNPNFEQYIIDALGPLILRGGDVTVSITEGEPDEDVERLERFDDAEAEDSIRQLYAVDNLETKLSSSLPDQLRGYLQRNNLPRNASMDRARYVFKKHSINDVRDVLAMGSRRMQSIRNFGEGASRETKSVLESIGFTWHEQPSVRYMAALYGSPDKMPARVVNDLLRWAECSLDVLAAKNQTEIKDFLERCRIKPAHSKDMAVYCMESVRSIMAAFEEIKTQKL